MNFQFLRGQVPQDRSPKEIMWNSLDECDDAWEHLFASLVSSHDTGRIIYWGGKRRVYYRENLCVEWLKSLDCELIDTPDVVIARGGFREYDQYLERCGNALKIYYGANHGCIPSKRIHYDLVLVDCQQQKEYVESKGLRAHIIHKPAPLIFKPMDYAKKYDCAYVAVHPLNKRKNLNWVYETCPKDISVLQLGNSPRGFKVPKNFTIKRIQHKKMPKALNKCRTLIAPYTGEDSGPRCITEAEACNVRPIILDSVNIEHRRRMVAEKKDFWQMVNVALALHNSAPESTLVRQFYEDNINNNNLKSLIESLRGA